jgi:hypothetical protein
MIVSDPENKDYPMFLWDSVRGLIGINALGVQAAKVLVQNPVQLANPVTMLIKAMDIPPKSILFTLNLNRYFDAQVIQGLWNLRDLFKQHRRSIVNLSPSIKLPPELAQDILILDEPLPTAVQLAGIIGEVYAATSVPKPNNDTVTKAVDALVGLAAFSAEQVCAMSIRKDGLDIDQLWERKRKMIEQTPGLSVYRGTETFKDVKGCDNFTKYASALMNGEDAPSVVAFSDEIDKMFSGMNNSQDSITKEMVGEWLTWCETKLQNGEPKVVGLTLFGPPGTGKSLLAKALGNEFKRPTIITDMSAMKDSLVGQSQRNFNMATKVMDAMSGDKPIFYITTCNNTESLPMEVRRRLAFGQFFVDLPTFAGRNQLWDLYMKRYKLDEQELPANTGWTGAEIRNCCMLAHRLRCSIMTASKYIVPVCISSRDKIVALRHEADGNFLSADQEGIYKAPAGIEEAPDQVEVVAIIGARRGGSRKIDPAPSKGGKDGAN